MRGTVRSLSAALVALAALLALAWTSTTAALLKLAAATGATVLIMGGTGAPLSTPPDSTSYIKQYMAQAVNQYVSPASTLTPPTGIPRGPYNAVAVITPEEWAPKLGTLTLSQSLVVGREKLDNCIKAADCVYNTAVGSTAPQASDAFVVYGFSQSASVATLEKRSLAAEYADGEGPNVTFVLVANGNRPNGGFLARGPQGFTVPTGLPFAGATFNGATPTDTQYGTVDVAYQYDGWSDFPVNPLNLLADLNAILGVTYLHTSASGYASHSLTDPGVIDQGQYGDTHYYLISTPVLPLLMPLKQIPLIGSVLADALDPTLRVLVEAGYDRSTSPGVPTSWNPLYFPNLLKLAVNLVMSIPTGLDNGIQDLFGVRPFGTTRPGPYGLGGAAVQYTTDPAIDSASADVVSAEGTPTAIDHRRRSSRVSAGTTASLLAATATSTIRASTTLTTKAFTLPTTKALTTLPERTLTEKLRPRASIASPEATAADAAGGGEVDRPTQVDRPTKPNTGVSTHKVHADATPAS